MSLRRGAAAALPCVAALIAAGSLTAAHAATGTPAHAATESRGGDPAPHYTGRVVIQLAGSTRRGPAADAERVRRVAAAAGGSATLGQQTATGATIVQVGGDPVAAAARIASAPGVEYAVPERRAYPTADPSDPAFPWQWDLPAIGVPNAWTHTRGAGVTVAVVDTGWLPHPDLPRPLPGYDFIGDAAYALDGDGRDADATDAGDWTPYGVCEDPTARASSWHGLHVTGTLAAITDNGGGVSGIAPDTRVVPVRALGRCGGTDTDITDALVWAAGGTVPGAPANANPAKIINLSLSGPGACSPVEQRAIDAATSRGALVVVAAGNDGRDVASYTPANCHGVLVVAASDRSGAAATYTNRGSAVTLSAPGSTIYSLGNTGPRGYDPSGWSYLPRSGTSMAAAHVSAVAALMWSVAPTLTAAQVRDVLLRTATRWPGATTGAGAGIVNAAAAVEAVLPANRRAPTVARLSPGVVRTRGGDLITITGADLAGASVSIGGRAATVTSSLADRVVVSAPPGAAGPAMLVLSTIGGSVSVPIAYDVRYGITRSGSGFTPRA